MVCVLTLYQAYFYIERHKIDNCSDKFLLFAKLLNTAGLFWKSLYSLVHRLLIFFNTHLKITNIILVSQLIWWGVWRTTWCGRFIFKKVVYDYDNDNYDEDDELFLWYGWPTKGV